MPEDTQGFERRAGCLVDEYSGFVAVQNVHVDGKLTLGENTADNGGLRLAYMVLMASLANAAPTKIGGFTPAQRLFLGYGQVWCENIRDEAALLYARTDPHTPARFRVNGVLQDLPEFQKAFGCQTGQPMVGRPACRVW